MTGCTGTLREGLARLIAPRSGDPAVGHHSPQLLAVEAPDRDGATSSARVGLPPLPDPLSEPELQVLGLLDSELSGPQIAAALFISLVTLSTHTQHIFWGVNLASGGKPERAVMTPSWPCCADCAWWLRPAEPEGSGTAHATSASNGDH